MAKKIKRMPKGLQVYNLKKFLRKKGVSPDSVDVSALVDKNLSYEENRKQVKRMLGLDGKKKVTKQTLEEDVLRQARMYHESRSERAQALDDKLKAKIPEDSDKWFKNPGRWDLPGIDLGKKKRKR